MNTVFFRSISLVILLAFVCVSSTLAARPDESEFRAASLLGEDVGTWISRLENPPASIGIFFINVNEPLEEEYATIVEVEILKGLARYGIPNVYTCSECRSPVTTVENEHVVIAKGSPDPEILKKIASKRKVDSYLTLDVYRTSFNVIAQAVLYRNPTGEVIGAEKFAIPALSFSDSSVQFLATFGVGKSFDKSDTSLNTGVNLLLLEELGFAKGGLNIGMIMANQSTIYINPTLAFYGRFGSSGLGWSLDLGAGLGLMGAEKGLSLRGAWELYMGALTVLGVEAAYILPVGNPNAPQRGYAGFHIGFALGR